MIDLGSLQNFGLNFIWLKVNVEFPLLNLFGGRDDPIELLNASDPLMRLLEETLSDVGHDTLALSDLCWYTDQCAEFRWQVNILAFLTDLEQWLINGMYLYLVSFSEVVNHICSGLLITTLVEDVVLRVHIPLDLMDFVTTVRTIFGHYNSTLEFSIDIECVVSSQSFVN